MAKRGKTGQAAAKKRKAHGEAIKKAKEAVELKKMAGREPAYTSPELYAWRLAEYMWQQAKKKDGVITLMGMARALGVSQDALKDYGSGSMDHYARPIYDSTGGLRQAREPKPLVDRYIKLYRQKDFLYPYYAYITAGALPPGDSEIALEDLLLVDSDTGDVCIGGEVQKGQSLWFSAITAHARALLGEDVEVRLATSGRRGDILRASHLLGWETRRIETHRVEIATIEDSKRALEELKLLE